MALPPENLNSARAIVIEDVPPGTGIADLIRAFSAFGPIRFASVGPPALVSFETEAATAQALLVTSMKSVSLLGAFRERKLQVPAPASAQPAASRNNASPSSTLPPQLGASTETEIGSNAASPAELAASHTKMSPAAKALVEILDKRMQMQLDRVSRLESMLHDLKRVKDEVHGQIQTGSTPAPAPAQPATSRNHPSSGSIKVAPPAKAAAPKTKTSPNEIQPPVREKKLPVPPPAQPAASRNEQSSGASLASARENTAGRLRHWQIKSGAQ